MKKDLELHQLNDAEPCLFAVTGVRPVTNVRTALSGTGVSETLGRWPDLFR